MLDDLDTQQVLAVAGAAVLGVALMATVGFLTGTLEVGENSWVISEHAAMAGLVALGAGFIIGGREIDGMDTWEIGAVGVAIATIGSAEWIDQVADFIAENDPHAGVAAVAIGFVGYYVLVWR